MLLRHTNKAVLLPDFLVPGLLNYRAASSSASRPARDKQAKPAYDTAKLAVFPVDCKPAPALYKNITERINALHSGSNTLAQDENIGAFNATAGKLRTALKAGDVLAAFKYWTSLEEKGLFSVLGVTIVEGYSELITDIIPAPNKPHTWTHAEREAAEHIALGAATIGKATRALSACMLHSISGGDPDAALALFDRYLAVSSESLQTNVDPGKAELGEKPRETHSESHNISLTDKILGYSPGRSEVLLMATAAHAAKDAFPDALRTYLRTSFRIPPSALQGNLKAFAFDPSLRAKVQFFVPRLEIGRLIANPASLRQHISNLVDAHALDRLQRDYKAILDATSGPDAFVALHVDAVTDTKPVIMAEASWGDFLTAFLRLRRQDLAEKLWDDMVARTIIPGVVTWTALFDGYDSLGKVEGTLAGWEAMLAQGVKPNAFTYRSLCSVLCTARRPDDALKAMKDFEDTLPKKSHPVENTLPLYNTLIHGLLTNSREAEASTILQKMQEGGPKPNVVTYNTFLRYFGRKADFKGLGSTLERLTTDGLVGDTFTFTTILSALLKAGREDAEEITFNLINKQKVAPDTGFYTALIDHQVRLKEPQNMKAALSILKRMEQDPEIRMNPVPYTSILAGIYRVHWLDPEVAEECKEYVISRMKSSSTSPNRVTYHILISATLENQHPEGLQQALSLYREMRRRLIGMSNDTWYVLLNGLIQRGEWAMANEMVADLRKIGDVKPVGATLKLVDRIRKHALQKAHRGPSAYI
ncbi:hypothetical protein FIBSPDRAFT_865610 [Athelia psychrophila]|uniref:Pentacotripeptide-repeat region of PRORP domain-containing protein n=1 Tax=Athelia psychrophila TaxID=1759441 RepID=A0A166FJ02_9AGAM|nr:hypothetical protein FIBSPDRAFT_865610 [Fibularhizoctonia sp. CBS 109695]